MNRDSLRAGIELVRCAEPLTPAAEPSRDGDSNWARCDAYSALRSQIENYARGKILGQSILLAGHRGSGKTTLVHLAVQQVRWIAECRAEPDWQPPSTVTFVKKKSGPDIHEWVCQNASGPDATRALKMRLERKDPRSCRWTFIFEGDGLLDLIGIPRIELDESSSAGLFVLSPKGGSWLDKFGLVAFAPEESRVSPRDVKRAFHGSGKPSADVTKCARPSAKDTSAFGDAHLALELNIQFDWSDRLRRCEIKIRQEIFEKSSDQIELVLTRMIRNEFAAIPILVPLHGPDLFLAKGDPKLDDGRELAEQAMSQISKAAHRSLAEEIGKRFCELASKSGNSELMEAAVQFRIELDQTPSLPLLRMFWEKAGVLQVGLLQHFRQSTGRITRSRNPHSQGLSEVLAMHTAIAAVRWSEGAESETEKTDSVGKSGGPRQKNTGGGIDGVVDQLGSANRLQDAVRLAAPVLSLLAGAFATSAVVDLLGPITAGAIGFITVMLAYFFLRRTLPPARTDTLAADKSISSQDLFLPLLVERALDAGFAPIFVVDELDKIQGDLDKKLGMLIMRLKHFVTDRAFFCFVADRGYYEQFQNIIRHARHPIQETYFAELLLIYYGHKEFHDYLGKAIGTSSNRAVSQVHRDLLRYMLQLYAGAHVGSLTRVLREHSEDGHIRLDDNRLWTVAGYRFAITMQVAIELVRRTHLVAERLRQEPHFSQWLNDALYHFPRTWRQDKKVVEFQSEQSNEDDVSLTFDKLEGRIRPVSLPFDTDAPYLDPRDREFLFERMKELAEYLAHPNRLAFEVLINDETQHEEEFPAAIKLVVSQSMPIVAFEEAHEVGAIRCKWKFDQFGRTGPTEPRSSATKEWLREVAAGENTQALFSARFQLLSEFEEFIEGLNGQNGLTVIAGMLSAQITADKIEVADETKSYFDAARMYSTSSLGVMTFEAALEDFNSVRTFALPRLAIECLLIKYWRVYVFPLLAISAYRWRENDLVSLEELIKTKPSDASFLDWLTREMRHLRTSQERYEQQFSNDALQYLAELKARPKSEAPAHWYAP